MTRWKLSASEDFAQAVVRKFSVGLGTVDHYRPPSVPSHCFSHNGYHRFRCCLCETVFCSSCRSMPYHMGFDCDGWKVHQTKPKCTYCGDAAEEPGTTRNAHRNGGCECTTNLGGCQEWGLSRGPRNDQATHRPRAFFL